MQPRKLHSFDHPHPVVQESDEYDQDYPKDENSDSGEWKAQFTYDTLRSKIHAAKNLERMRKQMLEEAQTEMRKAAEEEKAAVQKAETLRNEAEHEKEVKAAKERAKEWAAQKNREGAEKDAAAAADGGAIGSNGTAGDVETAMKEVEGEMKDLEDCKKKLKEAQDQLKDTMERSQKGKAALEDIKTKSAEEIAAQEKAEKEAEALAAAKEKEKAEQEAKAKEQAEIHEQAKKEWSLTSKELKEMEDKLKKAEERLRAFRHKQVTPGGGIYDAPDEKKYDPCEGCPPKTSMASKGDSLAVAGTERTAPAGGPPATPSAAFRSTGLVGLIVLLSGALF